MKFCVKLPILSAISCLALAMTVGCGSNPVGLNGNYQFTATSTAPANSRVSPNPAIAILSPMPTFAGSLSAKAGVVSGVLQNTNNSCFRSGDIAVTGTLQGTSLTLTSAAVGGETLNVTATVSTDDATITSGSYTITGLCGDKGTIVGSRIPMLKGTLVGDFSSGAVTATTHTTIQVTQTPTADAHGLFHLTATATFSGSKCFTKGTVTDQVNNTFVLGPFVGVKITTDETAGSTVSAYGVFDPASKTLKTQYTVQGGQCNGDYGSGTLTLQ